MPRRPLQAPWVAPIRPVGHHPNRRAQRRRLPEGAGGKAGPPVGVKFQYFVPSRRGGCWWCNCTNHQSTCQMGRHKNAKLTGSGTIGDGSAGDGWSGRAQRPWPRPLGARPRIVRKWVARYRAQGEAGLEDRSSRPRRLRAVTAAEIVGRKLTQLRRQRWTQQRIAWGHRSGQILSQSIPGQGRTAATAAYGRRWPSYATSARNLAICCTSIPRKLGRIELSGASHHGRPPRPREGCRLGMCPRLRR